MRIMKWVYLYFLFVMGCRKALHWKRKYKRCTVRTQATVIDFKLERDGDELAALHQPVLEVRGANGEPRHLYAERINLLRLPVGETIEICRNPNDDEEFRYSGKQQRKILLFEFGMLFLPSILLLVFAACLKLI